MTPIGPRLVLDYDEEALFCATAPQLSPGHIEPRTERILGLFGHAVELIAVHWQRNIEPLFGGLDADGTLFEREPLEIRSQGYGKLANDGPEFWIVEHRWGRGTHIPHGRIIKWPRIAKGERFNALQLRELYDFGELGAELEFGSFNDRNENGKLPNGSLSFAFRLGPRLYTLKPPWIYRAGELRPPITDGHPLANDPVLEKRAAKVAVGQFLPRHPFRFLTWQGHSAEILSTLSQHAALIRAPIQDENGRDLPLSRFRVLRPWSKQEHGWQPQPEANARQMLADLSAAAAHVVATMGKGSKFPIGARPPKRRRTIRPWGAGDEWSFRDQLDLELSAATLGVTAFDPFWDRYAPDRSPHHSSRELLERRARMYQDLRLNLVGRIRTPNSLGAWMLNNVDFQSTDKAALRRLSDISIHQMGIDEDRRLSLAMGGKPWRIQKTADGHWKSWQFEDYVTTKLHTVPCRRTTGRNASFEGDFPESQDWQEQMLSGQLAIVSEPEPDQIEPAGDVVELDGLTEEQIHEVMGHSIPMAGEPSEKEIEQRARMQEKVRHAVASMTSKKGLEWVRLIAEEGLTPTEASRTIGEAPASGRKRMERLRERVRL